MGQQITKSVHPPGGAVALAAVSDSKEMAKRILTVADAAVVAVHWWYLLNPVTFACVIFFIVTIVVMNFRTKTRYPRFWL